MVLTGDGDTVSTRRDGSHETEKQDGPKRYPCQGFRREWRIFHKITAMHGVKRAWETKGCCPKIMWNIVLILCFIGMVVLIVFNIKDYINDNGSTQVVHQMEHNGMGFPKVTFCNYHSIKK
ncbi:hypothetical protein PFISCL1PPCAC_2234, partial [Pristionchus fissidentatus]